MNVLALLVEIQLITASGALAPGPLSISAIYHGLDGGWRSGFRVAIGHTIIEFPLYLLVGFGLVGIIQFLGLAPYLAVSGGVALLIFAYLQLISLRSEGDRDVLVRGDPVVTGMVLSGLNPYFLVWWVTIGAKLTLDIILTLGYLFLPILYIAHVWMDYAWLSILSYFGFVSTEKFGGRLMKILNIILAIIMLYYGISFMMDGLTNIFSLSVHNETFLWWLWILMPLW